MEREADEPATGGARGEGKGEALDVVAGQGRGRGRLVSVYALWEVAEAPAAHSSKSMGSGGGGAR